MVGEGKQGRRRQGGGLGNPRKEETGYPEEEVGSEKAFCFFAWFGYICCYFVSFFKKVIFSYIKGTRTHPP